MAGAAEFSSASSAGVNRKAAAPVLSGICAIRDDEVRIHGRLDVLERLVMSRQQCPDLFGSGAPFRIKLRTHMLLKLRYNFSRSRTFAMPRARSYAGRATAGAEY
jgi:hypothetical protein